MEYGLVALWLALYLLLTYIGATIASALFPRFAQRGIAFGLPVALGVLWLSTYLVGRVSITAGIWLGMLALVGAGFVVAYRRDPVDLRSFGEVAAVFTFAFLFLVWVRALDPAISPLAGEKFLDFGLVQSLLRADTLPPEDMWFAGEPVAYYYGGHLLTAILTRLTGTAGQYAYNLALAGFYATLVTGVYGLAGAVAAARDVPRRLAAGLSAFFVGIASNLTTPARGLLWLLPDSVASALAGAVGYELSGLANGPGEFYFWDASRVIKDDPADFATYTPARGYSVNEFPLFAWLNGDLHAHMMSTGFLVLAAALCFSYYQTPAEERRRRLALLFGALPAVGGLMAVTNTWSFPSIAGLAMVTVAMAPASPRSLLPTSLRDPVPREGAAGEGSRIGLAVAVAAGIAVLGLLWSLPFWFGVGSGREVTYLPDRSSIAELIGIHGLFLVPFALYLYAQVRRSFDTRQARFVGVGFLVSVVIGAVVDLAAIGLVLPLLVGAWLFARSPTGQPSSGPLPALADGGERPVGFETVLLVAGAGLVILVEFVFIKENVGRMNTVFKTYMQVWVLWAAAVGPILAWLLTRWRPDGERTRALVRNGTTVFVVVLVCSTSVYAAIALPNHVGRAGEPTLDGTHYLNESHPEEAEAIRWMDREIGGRPNIVTAAPAGYYWVPEEGRGASAPSSLTGIPTVAGWYHEAQYRNDSIYDERVEDVEAIYRGTPTQQRELLRQYDVEYVYNGPAERARYRTITVNRLEGVTEIHRSGEVVIYRVDQSALTES
jgi:YYY domain-containing protein